MLFSRRRFLVLLGLSPFVPPTTPCAAPEIAIRHKIRHKVCQLELNWNEHDIEMLTQEAVQCSGRLTHSPKLISILDKFMDCWKEEAIREGYDHLGYTDVYKIKSHAS